MKNNMTDELTATADALESSIKKAGAMSVCGCIALKAQCHSTVTLLEQGPDVVEALRRLAARFGGDEIEIERRDEENPEMSGYFELMADITMAQAEAEGGLR